MADDHRPTLPVETREEFRLRVVNARAARIIDRCSDSSPCSPPLVLPLRIGELTEAEVRVLPFGGSADDNSNVEVRREP